MTHRKGTAADAWLWKTTHGVRLGKYNPDGTPITPGNGAANPAATSSTPNSAAEAAWQQRVANIHAIYNPQFGAARDQAKASLSGYGDVFTWQADNPATPNVDESLLPPTVGANPESRYGSGQVYRDANRGTADSYAARGMLYSSYRDRALHGAYAMLNDTAKRIVVQYATDQSNRRNEENTAFTDAANKLVDLFGPDAQSIANFGFTDTTDFTPNFGGM